MAGNLGEATLELSVELGNLKRDLGRAERVIEKTGRDFEKDFSKSGKKAGNRFGKGITDSIRRQKTKFSSAIKKSFSSGGILNGIGLGIGNQLVGGITSALGAIKGQIGDVFKVGIEAEQTKIAFETLVGDATEAKKVIKDLIDFAATTPFELPEVRSAGRALLAFGVETDKLKGSLKAVGDISAGIGAPIGEIAEIFGKARVQGRLFGEDINQLTGRGIPIISELAKQFGVTESEVKNLVSKGEVNFGHLEQAFQDLTGEGGKFFDLMEKQSQSTGGKISNLADKFTQIKARIFEAIQPATIAVIDRLGVALTGVAAFVDRTAKAFEGFSSEGKQFALGTTAIIAVVTALTVAIGAVVAILSSGFVAALAAGTAAAAPFIAAGAAIAAVVTGIVVAVQRVIQWWDSMSEAQRQATRESQPLQAALGDTIDLVRSLTQWLIEQVPTVIEWGKQLVEVVVFLARQWKANFDATIEILNLFIIGLKRVIASAFEFRDNVIAAFVAVKDQATNNVNALRDNLDKAIAKARSILDSLIERFEMTKASIADAIGPKGVAIVKTFGNVTKAVIKGLIKPITNMIDLAKRAKDAVAGLGSIDLNPFNNGGNKNAATSGKAGNVLGFSVTSNVGNRTHPISGRQRFHAGTDFGTPTGTPLYAPSDATVSTSTYAGSAGNLITLKQLDGKVTRWMHLSKRVVEAGQKVKAGQLIGLSGNTGGSTGAHLHLEVKDSSGRLLNSSQTINYLKGLKSTKGQGGTNLSDSQLLAGVKDSDADGDHHHDHDHKHDHKGEIDLTKESSPELTPEQSGLSKLNPLEILGSQVQGLEQFKQIGDLSIGSAKGLGLADSKTQAMALEGVYEQMHFRLQEVLTAARAMDTTDFNLDEALQYQQSLSRLVQLQNEVQPGDTFEALQGALTSARQSADLESQRIQNDYLDGLINEESQIERLKENYGGLGSEISSLIPRVQTFILAASDPAASLNAQLLLQNLREIKREAAESEKEAENLHKTTSEYVGILQGELGQNAGSLFRNLITDINTADDAVGNFFDSLFNRIFDQALQKGIDALFGAIGGGGGGGFGAIIGSIFGAKSGGVIPGSSARIPNYKAGGVVGFVEQAGKALQREGSQGRLIAAQVGERVLTRQQNRNYERLMRRQVVGNYMSGGVVGNRAGSLAPAASGSSGVVRTEVINSKEYVSMDELQVYLRQTHDTAVQSSAAERSRDFRNTNYRKRNRLG